MNGHHVDDDTRDGDIHPQRPGPAGDPPMALKPAGQRTEKSYGHKGCNDDGDDDVRRQYAEIDWTDNSFAPKSSQPRVKMINQIAGEK